MSAAVPAQGGECIQGVPGAPVANLYPTETATLPGTPGAPSDDDDGHFHTRRAEQQEDQEQRKARTQEERNEKNLNSIVDSLTEADSDVRALYKLLDDRQIMEWFTDIIRERRLGDIPPEIVVLLAGFYCRETPSEKYGPDWPWEPDTYFFSTACFPMCRILRAHPAFATLTETEAWELAMSLLEGTLSIDPSEFCGFCFSQYLDDAENDFCYAFPRVKYSAGYSPLDDAFALAEKDPLFPDKHKNGEVKRFYRMLNAVFHLNRLNAKNGKDTICLPVETLPRYLNTVPTNVTKLRKRAEHAEYIVEVVPSNRAKHVASEFRVNENKIYGDSLEYRKRLEMPTIVPN